jgi:hypothetical protein
MASVDFTMAPVNDQNESSPVQSPSCSIKLHMSATSKVGQNEAINPRVEDLQKIEPRDVAQQQDIVTKTTTTISHDFIPLSKLPAFTTPGPRFTLFPKLPAELRLMIWKAALPGPRLVEVNFGFKNNEFCFGSELASCTSPTAPPAILGACGESRTEALKYYGLCFAMRDGQANISFDLEVDTLFITCEDLIHLLSSLNVVGGLRLPSFQGLRHLALRLYGDDLNVDPMDYLFLMQDLLGLETFTLVLHGRKNCGTDWQDMDIREVDTESEPNGYREKFAEVMEDDGLWMPGRWRKIPALKFMKVNEG